MHLMKYIVQNTTNLILADQIEINTLLFVKGCIRKDISYLLMFTRLLRIAIFMVIIRPVCAILKVAHIITSQAIDNTGTGWKFAGPTALAR